MSIFYNREFGGFGEVAGLINQSHLLKGQEVTEKLQLDTGMLESRCKSVTSSASSITVCHSLPVHALKWESLPEFVIPAPTWSFGYSEVCCIFRSFFRYLLESPNERATLSMKARLDWMRTKKTIYSGSGLVGTSVPVLLPIPQLTYVFYHTDRIHFNRDCAGGPLHLLDALL